MSEVHCWEDARSWYFEREDWDEYVKWNEHSGTCMLLDGHDGPHEWTPDSDIKVRFTDDGNLDAKRTA